MKKFILLFVSTLWFIVAGAQPLITAKDRTRQNQQTIKAYAAACTAGKTSTDINLNNVSTIIHTGGDMWWDFKVSRYEVPKGSGKTALWNGGIWIGGTDVNGQLKLAAVRYRSGGVDYFPGPLIMSGELRGTTDVEVCYQYDRHWEISRFQVETFRNWYNADDATRTREFKGYTIPESILEWPAHADAAAGYDFYMAPFWDNNDDGFYNPADGDYPFYDLDGILPCGTSREQRRPRLYGDGTLWWVYNDRGNIHMETGGENIGMEIRAQAFEFSTNDAVNDMSFYNYALINRSTYTLIDTYFGVYADGALGWAYDDYTGCHVSKGMGYYYNGVDVDGAGQAWAYGANPPAIGIDFFEGPYQDPNGKDDCSSWDAQRNLICNDCIMNGNINGLNFGDGIVDNERWGMRRFVYYVNTGGVTGDPSIAPEYYNFLRGYWKDNERMRYGGNAHPSGGGTGPFTDFMFPADSDPCGWGQNGIPMPNWTEETAGNEPGDKRFVESSGPFVLEPGAVNDITTGVVWARSYAGPPWASVITMLQEDEKAQRLFENCFKVIDGPDAPELTIVEQDQKLIFHIWNKPSSNNFMEKYQERDPFIVCPLNQPDCDVDYNFQGYQIWQFKTSSVSITDATSQNTNLTRIAFQCDIRDGVSRIINFNWDPDLEANVPVVEVKGNDSGIEHTFVLEEDLFAEGVRTLVNFKKYYYLAVAYAYNNFMKYDQNDPKTFEGQRKPYLAGRKGADGPIKMYEAIPHKIEPENGGTVIQGMFGASPEIVQVEGHGTGLNVVDITMETHDEIMKGAPWKASQIKYQRGKGPIIVKVVDPMNVIDDNYTIKFDSVNYFVSTSFMNGKVMDGNWFIYNSKHDTIRSESFVTNNYDQLILQWGLSVNISQAEIPFKYGSVNNGFLEATIEYANPGEVWLSFIPDDDRSGPRNWIRAGYNDGDNSDKNSVYEKVLEGTWAPFQICNMGLHGPAYDKAANAIDTKKQRLSSIDLYLTADRSKWSRSPVVETTDDPLLSIGGAGKFELRKNLSIDKGGEPGIAGSGADTVNENSPNYISETGMGWFPGYAIDVETGERLNIVYGESSFLTGDNGADMAWNPSTREGSKLYQANNRLDPGYTDVFFGGKHYVYIMGHNRTQPGKKDVNYFPNYDAGRFYVEKMADTKNTSRRQQLLVNAMWTAVPIADSRFIKPEDVATDVYGFMKTGNDIKIRLRVVGQYCVGVYDYAVPDSLALNDNEPMYEFNTRSLSVVTCDQNTAKNALKLIRVVPNPYYGNSAYELSQLDNLVKITNLPNICTVSIYSVNGNLVRRFTKDNSITYLDWDLKNQYGIPIASGAYIVHINAPGIGEKVVKFFGAIRPQDLNSL
jgi:hypothetical protein